MKTRYDRMQCYVIRPGAGGYEFLQLRRAAGDFMGGSWQIVHGGIHEGETAWQAALREVQEETGFAVAELYQLDTVNTFYLAADDAIWHCPGFVAVIDRESSPVPVLNEEHDAYRWLPREEFLKNVMWPGERTACAELCREILDDGPAKPFMRIAIPR